LERRAERMAETFEAFIAKDTDAVAERVDLGLAEQRVVVPPETAQSQSDGGGKRHRELAFDDAAHAALFLQWCTGEGYAVSMEPYRDGFYLFRRQTQFGAQFHEPVDRGLRVTAGRTRLQADAHRFPAGAQSGDGAFGFRTVGVTDQQAMLALDRVGCAEEPLTGERRGDQPVQGGFANLETLVPGAVDEE